MPGARASRFRFVAPLLALALALLGPGPAPAADDARPPLKLRLRSRVEAPQSGGRHRIVERATSWRPEETAFIVCDMWDLHHCLNAVRRGAELAPTMDRVLKAARGRGVTIIHAPSECMAAYEGHPAREHARRTPRAKDLPADIAGWCKQIPSEERGAYPIDQSDGGEDDDPAEHRRWAEKLAAMGRNPKTPWKTQTELLTIEPDDYISDKGEEIWSILDERRIRNVVLMGVHLNMCVLGRPFGLRQMAKNGKTVALMRDLTDTMYNPERAPRVNHFAGTDLMVEHVEKYVAPTLTSDQLLGGAPFRFKDDPRPEVAMVIAEDEYRTDVTLPAFASAHLLRDYRVSFILADGAERNELPGVGLLQSADLALISVRRRVLPTLQLDAIRRYVAAGKPVVGIRTASHAFAPRPKEPVPAGHTAWPEFDAEVLGGNYHGHHGVGAEAAVAAAPGAESHPIVRGVDASSLVGHGSLYRVSPLAPTATPLLLGSIPGSPQEAVAWVNAPASKGRVFYTSLGQIDDFAEPAFNRLLRNAIDWSAGRPAPTAEGG